MSSSSRPFFAKLTATLISACLIVAPAYGTCGGGGGGGMGGIASGAPTVYYVPWVLVSPEKPVPPGDLALFWFPKSRQEAEASSLRTSRSLTLWSSQCVAVGVVPSENTPMREHFKIGPETAVAVLASKDGIEIERIEAAKGKLAVGAVEKMVRVELNDREGAVKEMLKEAKQSQKQGNKDEAVTLYAEVTKQSCLFPTHAKKAAKALRKLGHDIQIGAIGDAPDLRQGTSKRIEALMEAGLAAERTERLTEARRYYEKAQRLDPADAVVLRFLGELHRHHTGDWARATEIFQQVLDMPSDRLSRAVAMHGLGKMTIHAGNFGGGVALFEKSVETFPLALTYRNLAVFWNSEKEPEKAQTYVDKALALEPDEPYNQIFAATYLAARGQASEATAIAERHHGMLAASYNLAAIYSLLGDRAKAFEYLKRHFYDYEQFDAVRAKEMREARDDVVFEHYHDDPEFIEMTALATSNPDSYHYNGATVVPAPAATPAGR